MQPEVDLFVLLSVQWESVFHVVSSVLSRVLNIKMIDNPCLKH